MGIILSILVVVSIVAGILLLCKVAGLNYVVRRLEDDRVVARFDSQWRAEEWLDDHTEEDVYYLDTEW